MFIYVVLAFSVTISILSISLYIYQQTGYKSLFFSNYSVSLNMQQNSLPQNAFMKIH